MNIQIDILAKNLIKKLFIWLETREKEGKNGKKTVWERQNFGEENNEDIFSEETLSESMKMEMRDPVGNVGVLKV
jgi:hypothetical protein